MALTQRQFNALKRKLAKRKQETGESTFLSRAKESLKERAGELKKTYEEVASGKIHPLEGSYRTVGDVAGGFGDVIGAALSPQVEKLSRVESLKPAFSALGQGMEKYETWKGSSETNRRIAEVLEATVNIADLVGGLKGGGALVKTGKEVAEVGARQVGSVARRSADIVRGGVGRAKTAIQPPPPTPIRAVGQVLQGTTQDIKAGVGGLAEISTDGIKTFKDLSKRITGRIGELSRQVDEDLIKDTTKRKLTDLVQTVKSEAGNVIRNRPVATAFTHLQELYEKIGDAPKLADIKGLFARAKKQGLTNKEINDLARQYGIEFGSKAFSKTGDALTSINAKLFENTRKSLKDFARSGITGETARIADRAMSNLYNTKRLVDKSVESVNKLKQKISERGLLEKVGHGVAKYGNVLSGGAIRGIVGGLLPRGVGYKTLNFLDLEDVLEKNLKIIQDAIKSGSDKEIVEILKKLNQ